MINSRLTAAILAGLAFAATAAAQAAPYFEKQSSFFVCDNSNCDQEDPEVTSAEIVAASADGMHLIYNDAPAGRVGFISITDPASPVALGSFALPSGSSPTSVAVSGDYLLVAVDTSDGDFVNPSGELRIYSVASCVDTNPISCGAPVIKELGGQPDSIAISPAGAADSFAAIAIENQRNEDGCFAGINTPVPAFDDNEAGCEGANPNYYYGILPQGPAGELDVIKLADEPSTWTVVRVALTGGAGAGLHEPLDPEVEYVSVRSDNVAVVSLQENNGYAIVDLTTPSVTRYIDAGEVDLLDVDLTDERPNLINLSQDANKYREPDAVAWIGNSELFASANEGDMRGGGRGFTLFNSTDGSVAFESYESSDYLQVMHGHYNDRRSDAKGNEPEAVLFAEFDEQELLFVGSERSNTVAVYDVADRDESNWPPMQVLNSGIGPEGLLAIPGRDLFVAANEEDEDIRSLVVIWKLLDGTAAEYPTIASGIVAEEDGPAGVVPERDGFAKPIAWGALSGLAADSAEDGRLFSVHDSFFRHSRIFKVDATSHPAMIDGEMVLQRNGSTVNYDLEGIAQAADGTFWLASEGAGNAPTPSTANLLVHVAADGTVLEEVALPAEIADKQKSNGYEGVTIEGEGTEERIYVAFQREWAGDPVGLVRIGEYRPHNGQWKFYWYPLDTVESPAGGWVGLSEITALGGRAFLIIERDNQAGRNARIKRIYHFDLDNGRTPQQAGSKGNGNGQAFPYVNKTLVYDLLGDYEGLNGWVPEKVEGLTVDADGEVFVVTDNDGVNGSTGETHFLSIGFIDDLLP